MGDRNKTRKTSRPRLEALGDRVVPAQLFWTGAVDNTWANGGNWILLNNTSRAPQTGDDLVFQASVTPNGQASITAANLDTNNNIGNLSLSSITINAPGYTLGNRAVTLTGGSVGQGSASGINANFAVGTNAASGVSTIALPVTFAVRNQAITTLSSTTTLNFTATAPISLGATAGAPIDLTFAVVPASGQTGGGTGGQASSVALGGIIQGFGNVVVGSATLPSNGTVTFAPAGRNNYSGTTTVIAGTLGLAGTGPVPISYTVPNQLVIGDDNAFNGQATVALGSSEQINDTSDVTIRSDGTLAVGAFIETIRNLAIGTAVGNGAVTGAGTLVLGQNITVTPSGQTNQIDPGINLGVGPHTFNVGGGNIPSQIGPDLRITSAITGFASSTLRFTGNGRTELRGASSLAATAFPTTISSGQVDLNNFSTGTGSVLPGNVIIGDPGGTGATLRLLGLDGISDTGVVTVNQGGVFDMSNTFAFSETIGGLSGTAANAQLLFGTNFNTLVIQPAINYSYAGQVTGTGNIEVQSAQTGAGSQRFSGSINLTGNFFGNDGLAADAGGILVVDAFNVRGGVSDRFTLGGVVAGTGSVDVLDFDFSGPTDILRPGTYTNIGGTISPATFDPGTLTAAQLGLGPFTLDIQINGVNDYGQLRVTESFLSTTFFSGPRLRVSLPTGFIPTGGQAFTVLDVVPVGLSLSNVNGFPLLFADQFGNFLNEGDIFSAFNSTAQFAISYRGGDGNDVVIYNTQAPTATLSGGTVSGNTATFTATFSGPVGPINPANVLVTTTGDVTFSFVNTIRLTDTTYLITVNGVTGTGALSVMLTQGAAFSGAGTPIQPSNTATVNVSVFNPSPPTPPTPIGNGRSGGRLLVGAGAGGSGGANVYAGQPVPSQVLTLPTPQFVGGTRVATGDFDRDGVRDYVFATGPGSSAFFQVLNGRNGALMFSANPFEASFTGGLNVSAGDLTGDGVADIVVTPDEGGGPRVMVFSGAGFAILADFFGITDPDFRGGARAAIGDLNGDGVGDVVVSAGFGGGPRVALFDGRSVLAGRPTKLINDFFVFEPGLRNGAYVAIADVNGDGRGDLVAGGGPGGAPRVSVFDGSSLVAGSVNQVSSFFAGNPNGRGGVRLAAADYDGNGTLSLVTGAGEGDGSGVRVYAPATLVSSDPIPLAAFDAFPGFTGGVFVG
jgi:hypothetical protein